MNRYNELTERVPLNALPLLVGRSREADIFLFDQTVSRRHARLERRQGRIWVVDQGSLHGTFVNEVAVRERVFEVQDLIRFGRHVQYRVRDEYLERLGSGGMGIRLENVALDAGDRTLLDGISLEIPAGSFVGILGPSGAGKTMLLRILGGIRPPTRGWIRTNFQDDIWQDIERHRAHLAYIPQKDILYPQLTVQEHLKFAGQLRLGLRFNNRQHQSRIEQTLMLLGLEQHATKPVAVLSGGQGKRVSVAVEWLRKPDLLILDEPSAGLDPGNEARLMEQLDSLARRGSTVVCSTHLMGHVRLFDLVVVMAVQRHCGVLAYVGPPQNLLGHFGCRHFADLYDKLETGVWRSDIADKAVGPVRSEGASKSVPSPLPPPRRRIVTSPAVGGMGRPPSASPPHRPPPLRKKEIKERRSAAREQLPPLRELIAPAVNADFLLQFAVVLWRSALVMWRDRWLRSMTIAQPFVLAILVSLIQFNPGKLKSLVFFSLVVACWLGMNNSIRDLVRDRRHYIRDRLGGMSPEAYLGAKWAFYALIGACQLIVFLILVRWLSPLIMPGHLAKELSDYSFLAWLAVLAIVYFCGLGLAFLVSALMRSEEAAVVWLPILILPQILISGMTTGVENMEQTDPRAFRPMIVTIRYPTQAAKTADSNRDDSKSEPESLGKWEVLVDMLSLAVYTRPAFLTFMQPSVAGFHRLIWIADLAHLIVLLTATYLAMFVTFRKAERRWPVLVGY